MWKTLYHDDIYVDTVDKIISQRYVNIKLWKTLYHGDRLRKKCGKLIHK